MIASMEILICSNAEQKAETVPLLSCRYLLFYHKQFLEYE